MNIKIRPAYGKEYNFLIITIYIYTCIYMRVGVSVYMCVGIYGTGRKNSYFICTICICTLVYPLLNT